MYGKPWRTNTRLSRSKSSHDSSPRRRHITSTRRKIMNDLAKVKRSEEHTSELQSPCNLVCRLLLEKKKKKTYIHKKHHSINNLKFTYKLYIIISYTIYTEVLS